MDKYKKLINNSLIFILGSFGSRLISFLMVPLYTHQLATSEYGFVDIMNTTVSLLIPLFTLELGQAALRFSIETSDPFEQDKVFNTISTHAILVTLIALISLPFLNYFNVFGNYSVMFIILLILRVINELYSQYIRGIGRVKEFAINGVLMTIITVVSNILLLVVFNFKAEGFILSLIFAALGSNLYLFFASSGIQRFKKYNTDRYLLKEMLRFSIPIIPNSAMWWIINSSTRYFILYFIGASGNGIYAVSNKVPAVISMATGIFSQAWQLSSFEEYHSETRDTFYTKIFNVYWVLLFTAGSGILIILKPVLANLVEDSYYESWQIAPMLIFAVIYQSFSSFLGTNYTASKKTKGSFSTSVYAGIISLVSSFILIPTIGLIGAGLSSALSFFVMFLIRIIDTKKYARIELEKVQFGLTNLLFVIQTGFLFITDGVSLLFIEVALFILILLVNKDILLSLFSVLISGVNSIKNKI